MVIAASNQNLEDLVRSDDVDVSHLVVVEQVVHYGAVVVNLLDIVGEEVPHIPGQAQLVLSQVPTDGHHPVFKCIDEFRGHRAEGFHSRQQALHALGLIGSSYQHVDLVIGLLQQAPQNEGAEETRPAGK